MPVPTACSGHRSLLAALLLLLAGPAAAQSTSDGVRAETGVDRVNTELGLTGSGAIVAVLDRGIDYEHPAFRNADGTTRLLMIFDTLDNTGANDPDNPTSFGTVYTRDEINAALASGVRLNTRDAVGHGTVTMGIAAGEGVDDTDRYVGMAPDADLIVVKLVTEGAPAHDGEPAEAPATYENRLFPSIDLVIATAAAAGKPVVMLGNFGSIQGPQDGTSADARGLDARFGPGLPGRVFITGTSDDGGIANHAGGTVVQGQTSEIHMRKGYAGFLRVDLWYPDSDRFSVEIESPSGTVYGPYNGPIGNGTSTGVTTSGLPFALYHNGSDRDFFGATSPRREILIDFNGAPGLYKIRLVGTSVTAGGRFDASLNPSTIFSAPNTRFETFVDPGRTVWDLATARGNLPMNSYVLQPTWVDVDGNTRTYVGNNVGTGRLWPGSGIGPTYDGRLGMAVSAPGQANFGAFAPRSNFARFRSNLVVDGPAPYGVLGFVSGAAPVVTGIVALLLEADPTLDAAEVREALEQTARADAFTGAVPNPSWGYGKVDAFAAATRVLATAGEADAEGAGLRLRVAPNPARGASTVTLALDAPEAVTVSVLDVLGREVARLHDGPLAAGAHAFRVEAARLPAGVYGVRVTADGAVTMRLLTVVR